jgi:hypothetical protein
MRKFVDRIASPIFKFLPTVLLTGALLILIVAQVFDVVIGLSPIKDNG